MSGTQQKRCGPKGGSKNPRVQKARRLRLKGLGDADLLNLGYTRNEIARSFIPNSVSIHQRCRVCGSKAIVDFERVCMACQMTARLKRERDEQKHTETVFENFEHPAILKAKN